MSVSSKSVSNSGASALIEMVSSDLRLMGHLLVLYIPCSILPGDSKILDGFALLHPMLMVKLTQYYYRKFDLRLTTKRLPYCTLHSKYLPTQSALY